MSQKTTAKLKEAQDHSVRPNSLAFKKMVQASRGVQFNGILQGDAGTDYHFTDHVVVDGQNRLSALRDMFDYLQQTTKDGGNNV